MCRRSGEQQGFSVADAVLVMMIATFGLAVLASGVQTLLTARHRTTSVLECRKLLADFLGGIRTAEDLYLLQGTETREQIEGRCRLRIERVDPGTRTVVIAYRAETVPRWETRTVNLALSR